MPWAKDSGKSLLVAALQARLGVRVSPKVTSKLNQARKRPRLCALTMKTKFIFVLAFCVSLTIFAPKGSGQTTELHQDCAALSAPGTYPDFERLPHYTVEDQDRGNPPEAVLFLRIYVPPGAIDMGSLIRLACDLASRYPKEKNMDALVFDDKKAARNLAPGFTDQKDNGTYLWHLRAHYSRAKEQGVEYIKFTLPVYRDGLLSLKQYKVWLKPAR